MRMACLEALFFTPRSLQAPLAWTGHVPFAAYLVKQLRPKCFVELGTHSGNSYFAFCQALKEAHIPVATYAVDTWLGDAQASLYTEDVYTYVSSHNEEFYADFSNLLRMTFDEAVNSFPDGSIDLLHIDGFHSYEAVSHDFTTWLPKLAPGAVVLFHDINERSPGYGVWQFWEEVQTKYGNTFSFLHSHGLGVLQLDGATPEKQLELFTLSPEEQQTFRNSFAAMGKRHQYRCRRDELQKNHDLIEANRDDILAKMKWVQEQKDAAIAEIEHIQCSLEEKNAALLAKDTALAETRSVLQEVLASRSWRITHPLRLLFSCLRKARSGFS